ncbi:MAG: hypothetical protein WC783_05915 [Candidatus Paceibacterota bacterium]|jgi:hypothetical protein
MELPIQIKFFRKLELYQEYKFSEEKNRQTRHRVWEIEKQILKWAIDNHHHLESPLSNEYIKKNILKSSDAGYLNNLEPAVGNLRVKKFARQVDGGVEITLEGLMMGEVMHDIEETRLGRFKYNSFILVVWLTIFAGVLTVVYEGWIRLWNILT